MKSKASLVLIELAVMLLVFALAGAWCMKAFAWAESASFSESETDQAYAQLQTAAETLKACGGDHRKAMERLTEIWSAEAVYVNGIWKLTDPAGVYTLQMQEEACELFLLCRSKLTVFRSDGTEVASVYVHWQEVSP